MDGGVYFSRPVKPRRKRRRIIQHSWLKLPLQRRFLASSSRSSPHKDHQALKAVFVLAKPCNYIVTWCTEDFLPKATFRPAKWSVLLSDFAQFGPMKFGRCRRAAGLHFIPIQVSSALNWKLVNSVGGFLKCACSMAPQWDSHRHN